ncbi:hypothetical protein [Streptomyces osmaniensis]|uniref:Uncharacterized protein n=1 Tax=Streptomyces osmaniensis TaxID=593134 RepID=A0ABP6YVY2_9ACTN|nr:hypothetical protein KJK32_46710 [Streptomyces sp. JCM17656]
MSITLTEKAVPGRRIAFTYYRDLKRPNPPEHTGIVTALVPDQGASLKIRLDGKRTSLHSRPDYQGLRYLDEVITPVPELPMGPFTPTVEHLGGEWEGVPACLLESATGEEHVIALTDVPELAAAAVVGCLTESGWDPEYIDLDRLEPCWAVFEWKPEDSESPWKVRWDAAEGDDHAIRAHYLPV